MHTFTIVMFSELLLIFISKLPVGQFQLTYNTDVMTIIVITKIMTVRLALWNRIALFSFIDVPSPSVKGTGQRCTLHESNSDCSRSLPGN